MSSLRNTTPLRFFSLERAAILRAGLKLRGLDPSPLPGRSNHTILFDGTPMPVYTDITRYETEAATATSGIDASGSDVGEAHGFPCLDNSGYIRNLLGHGATRDIPLFERDEGPAV